MNKPSCIRSLAFSLTLLATLSTLTLHSWASIDDTSANLPSRLVTEANALAVETIGQSYVLSFNFRIPYLPANLQPNTSYPISSYRTLNKDRNGNDIWSSDATLTAFADTSGCTISVNNIAIQKDILSYHIIFSDLTSGDEPFFATPMEITVSLSMEEVYGIVLDDPVVDTEVSTMTPSTAFSGSGDSRSDSTVVRSATDTATPVSNIVFEYASLSRNGKTLDAVDQDAAPFNLDIVYTDTGLHGTTLSDLLTSKTEAFLLPGGAFTATGSTRGTVQRMTGRSSAYPRFRVRFSNLTYNGSGNVLNFQTFYLFDDADSPVKGEGTAVLPEGLLIASSGDSAAKLGMAVPKLIIGSYDYGGQDIVAGNEFTLNLTILNTSEELPLENIVMTLTPAAGTSAGAGLLVASSSNTIYIPALDAGASQDYAVIFQARPDAESTSYPIDIAFSYEYIDTQKESRETAEMAESIAIPVVQLDRFSVDPITEICYTQVGQEGYLPVSFINRGMTETRNISFSLRVDHPAFPLASEHYGNLEPGGSDWIEIPFTCNQPGEYAGEVLVQYENDSNMPLQATVPCTIHVEQPYIPATATAFSPTVMEPEEPSTDWAFVFLCSFGGFVTVALIILILRRSRKNGKKEPFDEDF